MVLERTSYLFSLGSCHITSLKQQYKADSNPTLRVCRTVLQPLSHLKSTIDSDNNAKQDIYKIESFDIGDINLFCIL